VNVRLHHGGGASGAIADAAGPQLEHECRDFISRHGELKVTQPMHTSAGNIPPPVVCVIHIAGPDSKDYRDKEECYRLLRYTFRNCLLYANKVVNAHSVSVPAISSGN